MFKILESYMETLPENKTISILCDLGYVIDKYDPERKEEVRKSPMSELVNNLFNVKPNEEIVKALKGEIMIPKDKIPISLSNIKELLKNKDE
jgi:hypothetical protein